MNEEILILLLILIIVLTLLKCHYYKLQLKIKNLKCISLRRTLNEERLIHIQENNYYKNEIYKLSNDRENKCFANGNDVKYAIKYAMKCSHPDNGGSAEDFSFFNKLYKQVCGKKGV